MKRILISLLLFTFPTFVPAQTRAQQGTIVRMRMSDCMAAQHGFMAAMSGGPNVEPITLCPEYVLVAEKVVYVIIGKTSDQLIPLAEVTLFRLQKNEMLIRVDDAQKESHFRIKSMLLRPEWDRNQMLEEAGTDALVSRHIDPTAFRGQQ